MSTPALPPLPIAKLQIGDMLQIQNPATGQWGDYKVMDVRRDEGIETAWLTDPEGVVWALGWGMFMKATG